MKFLISIGNLDKNIFYPIISGLSCIIVKFILSKDKSNLEKYPLIISLESSMGMSLSFILLLIYKNDKKTNIGNREKDNKINKFNDIRKANSFELEYTDAYEDIIYGKYKYILLTSIMDFIQTIINYRFIYFNIKINMWIFDIIFISLFSQLILKSKMHRHHYISICLIILIGIIIDIIAKYYNNFYKNIINIGLKFLIEIIYSLSIVINKYTIEKKFSKGYEICFYQGLFTFILYTILFAIYCYFDDYIRYFYDITLNGLFIFFSFIILQFIMNLFLFITNEKTSPCHIIIIFIINQLGYYIIDFMKDFSITKEKIMIIIGLFFNIINISYI